MNRANHHEVKPVTIRNPIRNSENSPYGLSSMKDLDQTESGADALSEKSPFVCGVWYPIETRPSYGQFLVTNDAQLPDGAFEKIEMVEGPLQEPTEWVFWMAIPHWPSTGSIDDLLGCDHCLEDGKLNDGVCPVCGAEYHDY